MQFSLRVPRLYLLCLTIHMPVTQNSCDDAKCNILKVEHLYLNLHILCSHIDHMYFED